MVWTKLGSYRGFLRIGQRHISDIPGLHDNLMPFWDAPFRGINAAIAAYGCNNGKAFRWVSDNRQKRPCVLRRPERQ